jgi:hypothetical protein
LKAEEKHVFLTAGTKKKLQKAFNFWKRKIFLIIFLCILFRFSRIKKQLPKINLGFIYFFPAGNKPSPELNFNLWTIYGIGFQKRNKPGFLNVFIVKLRFLNDFFEL